jgi:hypothetical protein
MAFVLLKDGISAKSVAAFQDAWQRYRDYLASIAPRLPPAAREFALAEWHHDFADHRAPHDAWVESIAVSERGVGEREEDRTVNIKLRLLGAYHDGHIELEYKGVGRYTIGSELGSHGDWLYDEISLSDAGQVLHEIEIGGTTWLIECQDIMYAWLPRPNSSSSGREEA